MQSRSARHGETEPRRIRASGGIKLSYILSYIPPFCPIFSALIESACTKITMELCQVSAHTGATMEVALAQLLARLTPTAVADTLRAREARQLGLLESTSLEVGT